MFQTASLFSGSSKHLNSASFHFSSAPQDIHNLFPVSQNIQRIIIRIHVKHMELSSGISFLINPWEERFLTPLQLFPPDSWQSAQAYLGVSVAFVMLFYINKKLMYQYHKAVSCQHTRCYFKIISAITTPPVISLWNRLYNCYRCLFSKNRPKQTNLSSASACLLLTLFASFNSYILYENSYINSHILCEI